jgi:hypothetical protein
MAGVGSSSISFSGLKAAYVAGGRTDASGNSSLRDRKKNTSISLSFFRNTGLTDGTSIPSSGEISMNDDFKDKTFGSASNTFVTDNFNFNDDFSGEADRLYPVSSVSSTTRQTSSEHKFSRLFHSNVSHHYPSILLCPQTGDPTIGTEDDAEVWIKVNIVSPFHSQIGIVHKQGQSSWNDVASNALRVRHTTFNDRIALHSFGYITHTGHDVESSNKIDEITGGKITNATTTSNYHNRIGTTAGSGNGFGTIATTYNYLQSVPTHFYNSFTHTASTYYIGMKVNYYEITLTGQITNNSSTISNIQLNGSQLTETDTVYTGMYLSSDESDFPTVSTIIQSITYSPSTSLVMGDEINGSNAVVYSGTTNSNITFKAFGQRLEFQYADSLFIGPYNLGPNHIILPRKYRTSSNGSNLDIDSWAFFVGDSTTSTNTGTWSIQSTNPTLYPDISSDFIEISNRFIASTVNDYAGAYDVSETQVGLSGNYHIYIGIKVTAKTTYFNDISIAGVQVLDASNTVKTTWIFNTTSGDNWMTQTGQIGGSSTIGFTITPQTASNYTWSTNITTQISTGRFTYASSTTSNPTGTADGISGSTGVFPVGNGTIPQSSGTYYIYRETSGSTRYTGTVMRSPSITLAIGDKIRVAHLLAGSSSSPMNANDSLYLGAYPS